MTPLYPLRFREILRNYGFGDRWIVAAYEKTGLPKDHRVAETWEVCDRPNGESSEVTNGPLSGQTIHTLIDTYGADFLGRDVVARWGTRFPLLIKFLDASKVLGEQIHPTDPMAEAEGGADPGKTEAWYMLKVHRGGSIRAGNEPGVTSEDVRAAILDGTIKELMTPYAVEPGDAFLLYAGTMHYSAGGVLFYEIMQNSDITIGLHAPKDELSPEAREADLARKVMGVHVEEGFDAKTTPVTLTEGVNTHTYVFACRYFALERLDLVDPATIACDGQRFFVVSQIEGSATVSCGAHDEVLRPGQTLLLPANLGAVTVAPATRGCALLKTYVPDLAANIIAPLRAAGIEDSAIAALGGRTELNDLAALLWSA